MDSAGNVEALTGGDGDTSTTVITDQAIAGLAAGNDSPTLVGGATTLSATVTAGTNVDYTWAFGDGDHGSGALVTHIYQSVGIYTAVVTASNSISQLTAATIVTITGVADLAVTKQASPDPVRAGAQLTYTLRVTNTGNVDLHATVTDHLPAHVTPSGLLTWRPTITAPGGVWTQQVVVTVKKGYCRPLVNVVEVSTVEGATGVYIQTAAVIEHCIYLPLVLR